MFIIAVRVLQRTTKVVKAGNLLATRFRLNRAGTDAKRPFFVNISPKTVEALSAPYKDPSACSELKDHERIIAILHQSSYLGICCRVVDGSKEPSGKKRKAGDDDTFNKTTGSANWVPLDPTDFVAYLESAMWLNIVMSPCGSTSFRRPSTI